ncbi:MAG: MarR family transcriptional regulator, partial [Flavobacteriaceae bacterium]|nr:MarR family transcriptional regulator [Flavobacteriaceae bacterium]
NYVKRVEDRQNRRKIQVSITSQGLDLINSLDEIVDNNEEKKITKNLNKAELEQLNALLEKIRD